MELRNDNFFLGSTIYYIIVFLGAWFFWPIALVDFQRYSYVYNQTICLYTHDGDNKLIIHYFIFHIFRFVNILYYITDSCIYMLHIYIYKVYKISHSIFSFICAISYHVDWCIYLKRKRKRHSNINTQNNLFIHVK